MKATTAPDVKYPKVQITLPARVMEEPLYYVILYVARQVRAQSNNKLAGEFVDKATACKDIDELLALIRSYFIFRRSAKRFKVDKSVSS